MHIDRLCDALKLSADPQRNRDRVTHLMSSLVGALLFARAIDDPQRSAEILLAMRRHLKAEFCADANPSASAPAAPDFLRAF
jgi:hypothetical protein